MNTLKRPSNSPEHRIDPARGPRSTPPGELLAWVFSGMGLLSLVWFLVRVIPKPSRAAYPCQRAAFPVASSFVVWVMALLGSAFAWRKMRLRDARLWATCLWGAAALAGCVLVIASLPSSRIWADNPPHGIYGAAKGIFPGRVAWVYGPEATSWAGYSSAEHWYETNHTYLAVVEAMMSKAVQAVGGGSSDAAAWDAIFKYFNQRHGRGERGYQAGEKIAIKINLTTCNARSGSQTVDINGTYEKQNNYSDGHWQNTIDNSPQMLLSLLRHLVYTVGVDQTNIFLGDPTGNFPRYMWNKLHPEFPSVQYFDNYGGAGRVRAQPSSVRFYWSVTNAVNPSQPVVQDYVPMPFAQADYIINFAVLKGHSVGVTLCGKNFYGALLRCPDGYYRDANGLNQGGTLNYSSMHKSTTDPAQGGPPGLGHYRAIVDLVGSPVLGDKTVLWLVDGLFGGYYWDSHPRPWNMPPFNGRWPSSLFTSQDPVAIDSVCYDFLLNEWPAVVNNGGAATNTLQGGAEDYLHEAALANNPPSGSFYDPGKTGTRLASLGVHEHWNNPVDKQYSRNLGTGLGIELVALTATRPAPVLAISPTANQIILSWQASLGGKLQVSTNLTTAGSGAWSDLSNLPTVIQGRNMITNDLSGPTRFYRISF
jgi:Domain of unknown function (DUF362)